MSLLSSNFYWHINQDRDLENVVRYLSFQTTFWSKGTKSFVLNKKCRKRRNYVTQIEKSHPDKLFVAYRHSSSRVVGACCLRFGLLNSVTISSWLCRKTFTIGVWLNYWPKKLYPLLLIHLSQISNTIIVTSTTHTLDLKKCFGTLASSTNVTDNKQILP